MILQETILLIVYEKYITTYVVVDNNNKVCVTYFIWSPICVASKDNYKRTRNTLP